MCRNHNKKKQHSARLPSSWSTINGAKPLQKTVRRALPPFYISIFSYAHQKVVQNHCKKQHVVQPYLCPVPSNPSTHPNPNCKTVAKPLQKKHHFARTYLRCTSSVPLSISLTSRRTFNTSQRRLNTPQDGRNVAPGGAKTAQNLCNLAQDGSERHA